MGTWVTQTTNVYANDAAAIYALDPSGGGKNITANSTYAQVDPLGNETSGFLIFERYATGSTVITT